eukprot:26303-Pelagococcus_subviridis.AAC.1
MPAAARASAATRRPGTSSRCAGRHVGDGRMDGKFWLYESARPLSLSLSLRRPSVRPVVPPARLLTHPARPPPAPVRGPRRDVPKEEVHGLDADDEDRPSSSSSSGAFYTLVPIRPRSR